MLQTVTSEYILCTCFGEKQNIGHKNRQGEKVIPRCKKDNVFCLEIFMILLGEISYFIFLSNIEEVYRRRSLIYLCIRSLQATET